MKITHVISGLTAGGAQTMLYKLLSQMDQAAFASEVISLADVGPLDKKIRALGVPVRVLGMRAGVPNPLRSAQTRPLAATRSTRYGSNLDVPRRPHWRPRGQVSRRHPGGVEHS